MSYNPATYSIEDHPEIGKLLMHLVELYVQDEIPEDGLHIRTNMPPTQVVFDLHKYRKAFRYQKEDDPRVGPMDSLVFTAKTDAVVVRPRGSQYRGVQFKLFNPQTGEVMYDASEED
jgi:hypothetical protein